MLNVIFVLFSISINKTVYALESCIWVWFTTTGRRAYGGDPGLIPTIGGIRLQKIIFLFIHLFLNSNSDNFWSFLLAISLLVFKMTQKRKMTEGVTSYICYNGMELTNLFKGC